MRDGRWLAILALWLLGASAAAHSLGAPPGRLVDVGGRHMHLYCIGRGAPTVVIDTGLGGTSLEWDAVMRRIGGPSRVCVYDRAGYGWSEMGPYPRTSSQHANDLYLLLTNAGEEGPFVLAGHSYGGYTMQLFARRYPFLTAGLVLIDASHPEQVERFLAPPYRVRIAPSSSFGLVRFGDVPKPHPALPRIARDLIDFQYRNWRPRRTLSYELLGWRESEVALRAEPPLRPMPLVVLTRGRRVWPAGAHGDALEQLWINLQTELAAQSPISAHLLARASGHQIHLDQPDLVAFAIALAADAWRLRQGAGPALTDASAHWLSQLDMQSFSWLRDSLDVPLPVRVVQLDDRAFTP
ncbi:MAG: alpha/beta hydrolase [Gammaproteobacteria bacterium]|nr:alpha/beta hydrolase [Gammaproteobacteria bacterium]